jgi:predicted small secreted protein
MKNAATLVFLAAFSLVLTGCGNKQEGPAESAGKKIDQAAEKMQQKAGDAVEKAGQKLRQETDKLEQGGN